MRNQGSKPPLFVGIQPSLVRGTFRICYRARAAPLLDASHPPNKGYPPGEGCFLIRSHPTLASTPSTRPYKCSLTRPFSQSPPICGGTCCQAGSLAVPPLSSLIPTLRFLPLLAILCSSQKDLNVSPAPIHFHRRLDPHWNFTMFAL